MDVVAPGARLMEPGQTKGLGFLKSHARDSTRSTPSLSSRAIHFLRKLMSAKKGLPSTHITGILTLCNSRQRVSNAIPKNPTPIIGHQPPVFPCGLQLERLLTPSSRP